MSEVEREFRQKVRIPIAFDYFSFLDLAQVASEVFPQLPRIIEDFTRSLNHPSCSYSGLLSNGIPEGIGILTLEEGVIECGYFSNGKLNGRGRRIFLKDGEIIDGTFRDGKPIGKCFKIEDIESRWAFFDTKTDEVLKEGTGYPRELMSLPRFEDQEAFVKEFQVKTVATLLNSVVFDMKQNSEKIFFELYSPKISLVFTMNRGFVPRTPRSKSKHAEAEWGSFQKPSRPDGVVVEKIRSGQSRMTIERPNEQRNNSESKMSLSKFNFSRENSIKSKELFSESKRTIPPFSNDEEIGRELDVLEKEESDFNQDSFAINQNKRGMEERNHQSHRKSKERGHGAQMDPRRLSNGVKRLNEAQRNSKGSQVHFKEREIVKFEENESSLEKPSRIESAIPHGNHYNQPQSHNSEPQSQRHERAVSFKQENSVINCERIQYETPQKPSSSFIFQKDNHQKDIDSTLNEAKEIKRDKEMNLIISQSSLMASETRNNHSLRTLGRKYEEMSKVEAQKDNKKIKEMMQRRVNLSERPKTPERPLRTLGVSHPSANWDKTPPVLFRKAIEANSKNPSRVISSLVYEHPQEPERDEPSQKNKRNRHSKSKSKSPGVQINHYPTCSQTLDDDCQKMKRNKSPNIQSRYMDHLPMLSYKDLAQVLQAKKKSGVVFHGTMEDPESLQFQRNFRGISPQKSFSLFSDDGKYGFQERSLTRITSEVCGTSPSKNLEREFQRSLTKEITHAKPKIEIRKRKEAEDSKDKREARNSFDRLEPGEFPERDQENTGPFYQRAQTMKDSPGPMGSSLSHSGARTMERSRSRSGDSRTDTYGGNVHTQLAVDHRGFDVGHYPVYNKYQ